MNSSPRSTFINPHDLNIEDSKLVNMINSSRQINNESNFSQNDAIINPLERNIESKNNTPLVNNTNSQSMSHQNQSKTAENQNNSRLGNLKKAKNFSF
jgi:hypothetical protein